MNLSTKYIFCLILLISKGSLSAQHSSTELRHASGHGPYPITIKIQRTWAGGKNLFRDFINDFDNKYQATNPGSMVGFTGNLEIVIVSPHFLRMFGWEGLNIQGGKAGVHYRYLFRNIKNKQNLRLHIQEETIGINFGFRYNLLYPVTVEVIGGPTFYNFFGVAEHLDSKNDIDTTYSSYSFGFGLFERDPDQKKIFPGLDFKFRLNLLDPAGTEGGLGLCFEYGRTITFGRRQLVDLYDDFLDSDKKSSKSWDYGYFSVGLIVPLALRMVNREPPEN